jgi:hypothetical protein
MVYAISKEMLGYGAEYGETTLAIWQPFEKEFPLKNLIEVRLRGMRGMNFDVRGGPWDHLARVNNFVIRRACSYSTLVCL